MSCITSGHDVSYDTRTSADAVAAHSFECLQINVLPDLPDCVISMRMHIFRVQSHTDDPPAFVSASQPTRRKFKHAHLWQGGCKLSLRRIDSGQGGCKLSLTIVGTGAQEAAGVHSSHMGSVNRSTSLFAFSQLLSSVGMRSKSQELVQTIRGTL